MKDKQEKSRRNPTQPVTELLDLISQYLYRLSKVIENIPYFSLSNANRMKSAIPAQNEKDRLELASSQSYLLFKRIGWSLSVENLNIFCKSSITSKFSKRIRKRFESEVGHKRAYFPLVTLM